VISRGTWASKSLLSVTDQALFSGSTFLLNLLLAGFLPTAQYGAFSVAFSVFLFLAGFDNSLVLEPVSVFGPSKYRDEAPAYLVSALRIHLLVAGLIAAVAWLSALWMKDPMLSEALRAMALSAPFVLMLWFLRRTAYVFMDPASAILSSATYLSATLCALLVLRSYVPLSPRTGFLALACGSTVAMCANWRHTRMPAPARCVTDRPTLLLRALREHWDYGKWAMLGSALYVAIGQVQILFAALLGLEAAGVLRALLNFVLPMTQIATAISTFAVPALSQEFGAGSVATLKNKAHLMTFGLTATAVVYTLALWFGSAQIGRLFYHGKFAGHAWLLPVLGLQTVFNGFATGHAAVLRATQRPKDYLLAIAAAAPVALVSAAVCVKLWGLTGAAISTSLATLAMAITTYGFSRRALALEARRSFITDLALSTDLAGSF
jgi:O-antigen/teichoic acid export membrane protein